LRELHNLQTRLAYRFTDTGLLKQALTHRSATGTHLERMEFLGDAVLGLVISEELYAKQPDADEGMLSRMRAHLVCRDSLLTAARQWALADYLTVGKGERDAQGAIKAESILADAVEAVIGAVFLDGGWQSACTVVLSGWGNMLAEERQPDGRDAKTRLQEWTQAKGWGLPEYKVEDLGVEASPRFVATCYVQGREMGAGRGNRKKSAELLAAGQAWEQLSEQGS